MSKTIRRKNLKSDHLQAFQENNCLFTIGYFGCIFPVKKNYRKLSVEQYNKIMEAKYHSDKNVWGQVPSHFTRHLNKLYRTRMNHRIRCGIIHDELDNIVMDKRFNDARWHWL